MGQREDEADDHWTEFGDGPAYDPADYEAPVQPKPCEVLNGESVLARLIAEDGTFDRAPDNARVWIGGWSTYSGQRDPSLVHAGDIRKALQRPLEPSGGQDGGGEPRDTDRIGTHSPSCWSFGPRHYQCALAEIARLAALSTNGVAK